MLVVQKYGGSSVADIAGIHRVAARVCETVACGHRVVVVVSAMGNTTSELLALAGQVSARPGRRELDLLVSVGERVSMTLLAMAINDRGVPASSFTGSQSGIITDGEHASARVLEVRPHRVRRALDAGAVAIVAGFQGVSRSGDVTTLGRGGSDTTAVVLAAALTADWCELCSDVDGIYSADPRRVPGAHRLASLPLDAALALARAGAKVVSADAVEMARKMGVELRAAATARPSGTGTSLPPGPVPEAVVAVALHPRLELWPLTELTHDAGAPVAWFGGTVLVDPANRHDQAASGGGMKVAAVTAVGRSVVRDRAVALSALSAVPEALAWQAMDAQWMGVVSRDAAPEVARRLHTTLVEPE